MDIQVGDDIEYTNLLGKRDRATVVAVDAFAATLEVGPYGDQFRATPEGLRKANATVIPARNKPEIRFWR